MQDLSILLVDDDPVHLRLLSSYLESLGYKADQCLSGKKAIDMLTDDKKSYDIVFLDWLMPKISGLEVLEAVKHSSPNVAFIVLTANSSIKNAVEAMQNGACDFVTKPISMDRLESSLENATRIAKLQKEVVRLKKQVAEQEFKPNSMIAQSTGMQKINKLVIRASASNIPILIDGESGTGKEVMARTIRMNSPRAEAPFITVNCGAISKHLVESTLFGHEKGAFTGATHKHLGKFQEADGGTIFLDEIGELPLDIQVKLLRVLQEGEVDPVGGKKPVKVNVRILSATNRDLFDMVQKGEFREDLFYRLNVFQITLPPLRERKEDIGLLIDHFIQKFSSEEEKDITDVETKALDCLKHYPWPGNIRQLENIIFRAVVLADTDILTMDDFPKMILKDKAG